MTPSQFWSSSGFPNLVLARAAKANKRGLRLLEECKREELLRKPIAPAQATLVHALHLGACIFFGLVLRR